MALRTPWSRVVGIPLALLSIQAKGLVRGPGDNAAGGVSPAGLADYYELPLPRPWPLPWPWPLPGLEVLESTSVVRLPSSSVVGLPLLEDFVSPLTVDVVVSLVPMNFSMPSPLPGNGRFGHGLP